VLDEDVIVVRTLKRAAVFAGFNVQYHKSVVSWQNIIRTCVLW